LPRRSSEIKNPRSKLRGIGGRKEADQKNAASCGEYVPKEIKWRLWHGQVRRGLDLIAKTMAALEATAEAVSPATLKVTRLLGELETYVCGQSDTIIGYATARRREEPISTAVTESTVQWLVQRRMNAQQQMRWTPRGAHLIAQGSMRGNERFPPARSRRRRRARPPSRFVARHNPHFSDGLICPIHTQAGLANSESTQTAEMGRP
jgi:hypothetical protein